MVAYRPGETGEKLKEVYSDDRFRGKLRRLWRNLDSNSLRFSWIQFLALLIIAWPGTHILITIAAFTLFVRSPRYIDYRRRTKR